MTLDAILPLMLGVALFSVFFGDWIRMFKLKAAEIVVTLVLLAVLSTAGLYFINRSLPVHRMVDPEKLEQYRRGNP